MDLFPSMLMLDYELNDSMRSNDYDLSSNFSDSFGLAGGSDLLSEIFDDESFGSFKSDNTISITQASPIYSTLISKQRANRNASLQAKRNRVRMKAKIQQQPRQNQQQQFSSLLSHSNPLSHTGQSLIHNSHLAGRSGHSKPSMSHSQSALGGRAYTTATGSMPALPRVYIMQQKSSLTKRAPKSALLPAAKQCRSPAAPSVGAGASQNSGGISLLAKPAKRKLSKKPMTGADQRKVRAQYISSLSDHDYDKNVQDRLDTLLMRETERLKKMEERNAQEAKRQREAEKSNIKSEQQRLNNDLEDIADGFISEDVLLNELPNCLQDLFGFGEALLKDTGSCGTEDILDGLNDACNMMQNQFIDELISSSDVPDFNLTDDELNQMIGLIGEMDREEKEVEDSAIESASDAQNVKNDKSEASAANSECDDESDFFDGATLALSLAAKKNIIRNRKSSGSSSTRRKRRFSTRSSVASDSANSESSGSSIEPDSESNSSRPSSPDSVAGYGKVQFRKHPNKKTSKSESNLTDKVLFVDTIPSSKSNRIYYYD